jgi:hypothetical protein
VLNARQAHIRQPFVDTFPTVRSFNVNETCGSAFRVRRASTGSGYFQAAHPEFIDRFGERLGFTVGPE